MKHQYTDFDENMKLIIEESDDEEITEIEKTELSQCDIYYKFRYTFPDDEDFTDIHLQRTRAKLIYQFIKKFILGDRFTLGIEHFKSGMEEAKPHIHLHFVSRTKKDTIVKSLKRASKKEELDLFHTNRCYGLGVEVNVNEDKFFRYPLKQQKGDTYRFIRYGNFITKDRLIQLRDEAYAVWITACEIQNKKKEKKEDSDQLCDRLYCYLDSKGLNDDVTTDTQIKIHIQKFYIEEEKKPFNKTTALGYFYNYKITRNRMTHEQLACLW